MCSDYLASNVHYRTSSRVPTGGRWNYKLTRKVSAWMLPNAVGPREFAYRYQFFFAASTLPESSSSNSQRLSISVRRVLVSRQHTFFDQIRLSASLCRLRLLAPPPVSFPTRLPRSQPRSSGNQSPATSVCSAWNS
jgi:hypothetical protein